MNLLNLFLILNSISVFVLVECSTESVSVEEQISKWINFSEHNIGSFFQGLNDRYQNLIGNFTISQISTECRKSLDRYFRDPFQYDWSLKMWDSNGHFPSGILSGTFFEAGNFDQCLTINIDGDSEISGKYCVLEIRLPNELQQQLMIADDGKLNNSQSISHHHRKQWKKVIKFLSKWNHYSGVDNGICLPSTCTDDEINQIIPQVLIPSELNLQVRTKLCQSRSTQPSNLPLRLGQKIALAILLAHLVLVVIGTILSKFKNLNSVNSNRGIIQIIACFSIINNTRLLFDIRGDHSNSGPENNKNVPQLKFIHGIKVLSIYWIIVAHVFLFYPFLNLDNRISPVHSLEKRTGLIGNLLTHFIVNAGLAVETFFLISGALTIFTVLSLSKSKSFNFIEYVLLRWLRFSPSVLGSMCLLILWPIIGEGPLFHSEYLDFITEPCYRNWWMSFAYIANLFPSNQVCNVMHWYLSADFQLHILLFVVIYYYYKHPKLSIIYVILMLIIGFASPIFIVMMGWASAPNPSIFLHPTHQFPMDKVEVFIFATYNHLIPYFIGILFGLILIRKKTVKISPFTRWFIRLILFPVFLLLPFASYSFVGTTEPVDEPLQSAIMFGIVRIIWSLGIFWLCLEFIQQRINWLKCLMEHDFFQPFSRLTFCIYLVHILPIWHYMFTIKTPIEVSLYSLIFIGMGNAVFSTILAYLLYCLFERPYAQITKIFL